jgi:hypothetical protein
MEIGASGTTEPAFEASEWISKCHTELLETIVTPTKQTTEVLSKCHKTPLSQIANHAAAPPFSYGSEPGGP